MSDPAFNRLQNSCHTFDFVYFCVRRESDGGCFSFLDSKEAYEFNFFPPSLYFIENTFSLSSLSAFLHFGSPSPHSFFTFSVELCISHHPRLSLILAGKSDIMLWIWDYLFCFMVHWCEIWQDYQTPANDL